MKSCALEIKKVDGKGYGVFAVTSFKAEEQIEIAPVIRANRSEFTFANNSELREHLFIWGPDYAMTTGYFCLYNHCFEPNVKIVKHIEDQMIECIALRDIEAGEELQHNYLVTGAPNIKKIGFSYVK